MIRYNVMITASALADMEAIYDYIAEELLNPDAALGQYERIAETVKSLQEFPGRCKLLDSAQLRAIGMRRITVDNYTVIFMIRGEDVVATHVMYSASDINFRLMEDI